MFDPSGIWMLMDELWGVASFVTCCSRHGQRNDRSGAKGAESACQCSGDDRSSLRHTRWGQRARFYLQIAVDIFETEGFWLGDCSHYS